MVAAHFCLPLLWLLSNYGGIARNLVSTSRPLLAPTLTFFSKSWGAFRVQVCNFSWGNLNTELNHLLENLNNEPRAPNGPEEAHDYLWLTQDLWMEPAVWNWANESPDVMKAVLKVCSRTECTVGETKVAQFKRCSACHKVRLHSEHQ